MLRMIEGKEFPSLEFEKDRVLGDQLASSPQVTVGRLRPREGQGRPKVTQPVGQSRYQNPGKSAGKVQGKSQILLDSLHSREGKRICSFQVVQIQKKKKMYQVFCVCTWPELSA